MATITTLSYRDLLANFPKLAQQQSILIPLIEDDLLIAFSGDVDSSFLLWSAIETKDFMHQTKR